MCNFYCVLHVPFSFGGGKFLPVFVNGTNCTGNELELADCSSISYFASSCEYTQNVAIACNGKMMCEFYFTYA